MIYNEFISVLQGIEQKVDHFNKLILREHFLILAFKMTRVDLADKIFLSKYPPKTFPDSSPNQIICYS